MALINVNLQELKALVVDDSRTARRILREMLGEIPVAQVETAEDGADAIAKLRVFPADVVLCDLHMVPLDGIEFTRLLRSAEDSPNPYLPVLMLTADATETQMKNAIGAGVNEFMSKPVKMADLRRRIHDIFARPLIFVRDGRYLKPLRSARQDSQKTTTAEEPEPSPAPKREPIDHSEPGVEPITRSEMGFRGA
jgi:CheY-like chemotaxis protein